MQVPFGQYRFQSEAIAECKHTAQGKISVWRVDQTVISVVPPAQIPRQRASASIQNLSVMIGLAEPTRFKVCPTSITA